MPRDLAPPLAAAIAAPVVRPFVAIHIDLPDPVFAWTGTGTLLFAGSEWTGIEGLASIDTIAEETDGSATGITATLYRIPAEFRDDIADQAVRGCGMELWVGSLNETFQQVEAVKLVWRGRMDNYEVVDGGTDLTVTVSGESRAIDQRRPAIKRYVDEYQQRKHPGDRFFEYVPQMAEIAILWGKASQDATSGGARSGGGGGGGRGASLA